MTRTPLSERSLPDYTRGEEIFHMVSHIVGAAFGVVALILMLVTSALRRDPWALGASLVYGLSLVLLYTMSSLYHGLRRPMAKKVMQIFDHCTIYFLISGTYTPVLLCGIRELSPAWAWTLFGLLWGLTALAVTLTAIDLKASARFSMICYIAMGWCILLAVKPALAAIPATALWLILLGGVAYTVGAVLYGLGKRRRYMHSVFHVFVLLGTVLQFIAVYAYLIVR